MVWVPIVYILGGCNQFPPVCMKFVYDNNTLKSQESSYFYMNIKFRSFLNTFKQTDDI